MCGVRVILIGEGSVWMRGREVVLPKALVAMIGYLLLQPKHTASRDRLASAIWPASEDAAARNTLSSALYRARGAART